MTVECPVCGWRASRYASGKCAPCPRCGGVVHASVVAPGAKAGRVGGERDVQVPVMLRPWEVAELELAGKPGELLRSLGREFVRKRRAERLAAALEKTCG